MFINAESRCLVGASSAESVVQAVSGEESEHSYRTSFVEVHGSSHFTWTSPMLNWPHYVINLANLLLTLKALL